MQKTIYNILKLFAIIGVLISAIIIIFLIIDFGSSEELKETFIKALKIIGTLTITSIIIVFISKIGKTDILPK